MNLYFLLQFRILIQQLIHDHKTPSGSPERHMYACVNLSIVCVKLYSD